MQTPDFKTVSIVPDTVQIVDESEVNVGVSPEDAVTYCVKSIAADLTDMSLGKL